MPTSPQFYLWLVCIRASWLYSSLPWIKYSVVYTVHCTVYCNVHCRTYCTVYCVVHCSIYCIALCIVYCIVHCTVYCIVHCIVHCIMFCIFNVLCTEDSLARWIIKSPQSVCVKPLILVYYVVFRLSVKGKFSRLSYIDMDEKRRHFIKRRRRIMWFSTFFVFLKDPSDSGDSSDSSDKKINHNFSLIFFFTIYLKKKFFLQKCDKLRKLNCVET